MENTNHLNYTANAIVSREDFVNFVEVLIEDLKNNGSEWENDTLESYLEAIARWTDDMDGYYNNKGMQLPKNIEWKVFGQMLLASKVYE
jgi:hypothetical protein